MRRFKYNLSRKYLFKCEGRLKNAPLPYQAKAPHLINLEHYLTTLSKRYSYEIQHISIKETLAELRRNLSEILFENMLFVESTKDFLINT